MVIHKPINPITKIHNGVFLAGPCPRKGQDWTDWRYNFIDLLEKKYVDCEIINPTNENYDENRSSMYDDQCSWETTGMKLASVIVFWIDRNDQHPALTTNIEFGIWSNADVKRLVVGIPEGSEHCNYIKWVCKEKNIPCFSTMEEVVNEVSNIFSRPKRIFFTSDTHFCSERTRLYSKRPFKNTIEMDDALISNWNKVTTANDLVVHLGDFGCTDVIPLLNFDKLYILKGNYERDSEEFNDEITNYPNVKLFKSDIMPILNLLNAKYGLVHEPLINLLPNNDVPDFYLYGHIHEKGKVKRNGFNVGIDANNYQLVDLDTIEFYKNAILHHYDDNVFTEVVK